MRRCRRQRNRRAVPGRRNARLRKMVMAALSPFRTRADSAGGLRQNPPRRRTSRQSRDAARDDKEKIAPAVLNPVIRHGQVSNDNGLGVKWHLFQGWEGTIHDDCGGSQVTRLSQCIRD